MTTFTTRAGLAALLGAIACTIAAPAAAQSAPTQPTQPAPEVEALERLHRDSIQTRRLLADSVLVAGLVSLAGGGALIVPDADDQAWRFAGVNTAIFGAVNTFVALLALRGIAREEDTWESGAGLAARRTPEGLARARVHAAIDERRESAGHAVNIGLDCGYLGVAATAVLASQLGVDHPHRWLASGAAVGSQAIFLLGVDFIGLARSQTYHRAFVEGLMPTFAITPSAAGTETRVGLGGTF